MIFNSYEFLAFFPIVAVCYFIIPLKLRVYWLLAASYFFYMSWNPKYLILILTSTIVTYFSGVFMERFKTYRKQILTLCIVINLSILFFFKYFNWIIDNLNLILSSLGRTQIDTGLDVLLPVGISFYTFQALSYSIDVYRKEIEAEHNFFRYALFVSFFPQLVAGPIERSGNLLIQLKRMTEEKLFKYENLANGLIVMIWGFFLKMVIADRIAILVDSVFDSYNRYGSIELIVAAVGFSIQIYCDFRSYSIIAVGAAQVLGITLMSNFETPYFAVNIQDFWRRWHISLSTWFRDYVYIPMGGSRCSAAKRNVNLIATFLASGLWHGANWTYVFWGGIHGAFQIIGNATRSYKKRIWEKLHVNTSCWSWKFGQVACTFGLTTLAWIFFRCKSIGQAFGFIYRLVVKMDAWSLFDGTMFNLGLSQKEWNILIIALIILFVVDLLQYKLKKRIDIILAEQNMFFRWSVVIALIVIVLVYGEYGPNVTTDAFIYFQF